MSSNLQSVACTNVKLFVNNDIETLTHSHIKMFCQVTSSWLPANFVLDSQTQAYEVRVLRTLKFYIGKSLVRRGNYPWLSVS